MTKISLENITQREILLNVILLKTGNRNFTVEEVKRGLDCVSKEYPRTKMSWKQISDVFFFYNSYLYGELDNQHYRLSKEGKEIFKADFKKYNPELQDLLHRIAKKVWQYKN